MPKVLLPHSSRHSHLHANQEQEISKGWDGYTLPVLKIIGNPSNESDCAGLLCFEQNSTVAHPIQFAVSLPPRLVNFLIDFTTAMDADQDVAIEERGWCNLNELAQARYVNPDTLRGYRTQIHKRIRMAVNHVSANLPVPKLIETRRQMGFRLATRVLVDKVVRNW